MIHKVKDFSVVNEAEIDIFLEFPCFFYDPVNVGNLISGSSAFSKSSLYIWKFPVHVPLKPSLKDFENYFASVCSCMVALSSIPRSGRSPGEGNGNPLQYSCQENAMDRGS